ncbi:unnamed protein product [Phytophthora fragariaefolia]|uniref:Unnamed protein product n=1 Tax=Phytophthora fragariaefolia TaxID=1490495 RepID=A0A9W7D7V8_9STRA|nr:unnamed protein product [Phytophthora fragariaefolia]
MPQPSPAFGKAAQQPSPKAHFDTREPGPTDSILRPNLASSPRPDPMSPSGSPPPSSTSNTAHSPGNAAVTAPSSDSDATSRFVPPVVDLVPSALTRRDMCDRVALQRRIHAEAIKALHDQIGRLESQVVSLQSSASTASPQQAQRIQQLEASLAQAQADREATEVALQRSQEDSRALEDSQQALETSTQQLRRQIDTLQRRLHVDSARGAIARLEQRANDLEGDRDELLRLESSKATLIADLTAAQGARSAAESDRDRLQRELDDIRGQLSGLVDMVRPAAASPCRPSSPSRRRRRSRSPSTGGDSSRPRRRARPSSSSPRESSSASLPHSGSRSSPAPGLGSIKWQQCCTSC